MKSILITDSNTFSGRLTQACDDSPDIPEPNKGRQTYLAAKMGVSQEAARKWLAGLGIPRVEKMKKLADLLGVDHAWLALGEKGVSRDQKKLAGRSISAAVHLVASTLLFKGASCFFPTEKDPRRTFVDLYAGIRGEIYAIHVCSALRSENGVHQFSIPREFAEVRCVAVIATQGNQFDIIELPSELIEAHKERGSGDYTLTIDGALGEYCSGKDFFPMFNPLGGVE